MNQPISKARPASVRLRRHSLTRIIVLEEHRIVFLPLPKSGCTSVLWMLAELAGLERERFVRSETAEISRAMAIHDTGLWEPRHRWLEHSKAERLRMRADPFWLRFTIVRDPAPRLWSAWQSKLLLKEPRFVERFADEAWFPTRVRTLDEAVGAFRDFVHALDVPADDAPHDAHWGAQTGLTNDFDLNYVGRSERFGDTIDRIGAQLGADAALDTGVPRENAAPIPYHRSVYDDETAAIANRLYADDLAAFGYAPLGDEPPTEPLEQWRARATPGATMAAELAERHLRIGELLAALAEARRS